MSPQTTTTTTTGGPHKTGGAVPEFALGEDVLEKLKGIAGNYRTKLQMAGTIYAHSEGIARRDGQIERLSRHIETLENDLAGEKTKRQMTSDESTARWHGWEAERLRADAYKRVLSDLIGLEE